MINAIVAEFEKQLKEKPTAKFVRLTCEQLAKCYVNSKPTNIGGLPIVTRGSIADCNMREARPRVIYLDLTKVE